MKQIAAVCAAAALYIFTVFASARVSGAAGRPGRRAGNAAGPYGIGAPIDGRFHHHRRHGARNDAAVCAVCHRPAGCTVGGRLVSLVHSSVPGFAAFTYELCERLEISYPLVLGRDEGGKRFSHRRPAEREGADMVGIMQINSRYLASHYKRYGVTDAYTPRDNITIGVNMLAESIGKNGVHYGLMEYNMGIVNMRKKRDAGVTTTSYTRKVTAAAAGYEQELKKQGFSI